LNARCIDDWLTTNIPCAEVHNGTIDVPQPRLPPLRIMENGASEKIWLSNTGTICSYITDGYGCVVTLRLYCQRQYFPALTLHLASSHHSWTIIINLNVSAIGGSFG